MGITSNGSNIVLSGTYPSAVPDQWTTPNTEYYLGVPLTVTNADSACIDAGEVERWRTQPYEREYAVKALKAYYDHMQRQQEGWITSGTICGSTVSSNDINWHVNSANTITSNTLNFVIQTITSCSTDAFASYITPKRLDKSLFPPRMNHHGTLIRSNDRDQQFSDIGHQEMLALQLLRKMVSHEDFKKYLRHGFIPVRGASGLIYQVDRRNRIKVWDRGELLAHLCVHLKGQVPPTDEVVGKMLIIEYCEMDIWKRSNITWTTNNRNRRSLELVGQASTDHIQRSTINVNGGNVDLPEILMATG